jgi:DNA repair protein SbcC/Rad50
MIRRLALTNFRRHLDTELRFGVEDRLIVITGDNGAGKTTILEALLYSLYGESRNGRRGLDSLCSRGHEPEGVKVECEIDVAGTSYRVERRRVDKISSAALWADGVAIAEGTKAVDQEIRAILGMDAVGFKLAVIAKQKELDGLTSLSRQERRGVLARLLRVDVVAKAAETAHTKFVRASDVLAAMGPEPDVAASEAAATEAGNALQSTLDALTAATVRCGELDKVIVDGADTRAAMTAAREAASRAAGALAAAQSDVVDLTALLEAVDVPAEPAPLEMTPADVLDHLRSIELERQQAQAAADAVANHQALADMHAEVINETRALKTTLEEIATLESGLPAAQGELDEALGAGKKLRALREQVGDELAGAKSKLVAAGERIEALSQTGADCSVCGQPVTAQHREQELAAVLEAREAALGLIASATVRAAELDEQLESAMDRYRSCSDTLASLDSRLVDRDTLMAKLAELDRRRESYELRLNREVPQVPDADDITQREQLLLEALDAARAAQALWDEYNDASSRRADLQLRLDRAVAQVEVRTAAAHGARPSGDLVRAFAELEMANEHLQLEQRIVSHLTAELAKAEAVHSMAQQRLEDAEAFRVKRTTYADQARVAAHTKALLRQVHDRLATELRPNLEVAISDLLSRISDNRFPQVRLSEDYEISVLDNGVWRQLSDISGGEMDLVALATRLALAQVVGERSGSDALGLLILDEVFGSQDAGRRESILAALRELRTTFGQVFLISHVGGVEEAADKIVDITTNPERTETEVSVL